MAMMTSVATFKDYSSVESHYGENPNDFLESFGTRIIKRRSANQEKRGISLSYSATNINNKEGTQVKTITVIKNLNEKNEKQKIDPKLHKNENWAEVFKDNFASYGIIPDVPDVDDLFEYVNKKHNSKTGGEEIMSESKLENKQDFLTIKNDKRKKTFIISNKTTDSKELEKPVTEISAEISEETTENKKDIEKIKGDAELLPNFNSSRLKVREPMINLNYSAAGHSVQQHFEKYVQLSQGGKDFGAYDYPKPPCVHSQPIGSVTVATPSGKTYNIPFNNNSYVTPYLAPAITRRPQIVQQSTQTYTSNVPLFPINSLLPPLQQQPNNNNPAIHNFSLQQNLPGGVNNQQQHLPQLPNNSMQQPPFQNNFQSNQQQPSAPQQQQSQPPSQQGPNSFLSTSQRPYVSPNLRSGLNGVSRGPGTNYNNFNGFQNGQLSYRVNNAFLKPNNFRSRGLKY